MADISVLFPPIGFYLAFTLIFTYFLSEIKNQTTNSHNKQFDLDNIRNYVLINLAEFILLMSAYMITSYGWLVMLAACSIAPINDIQSFMFNENLTAFLCDAFNNKSAFASDVANLFTKPFNSNISSYERILVFLVLFMHTIIFMFLYLGGFLSLRGLSAQMKSKSSFK